jgi:hypothetical protein
LRRERGQGCPRSRRREAVSTRAGERAADDFCRVARGFRCNFDKKFFTTLGANPKP